MDVEQPPPILEFDPTHTAILEPHGPKVEGPISERGVLCFFQEVLQQLVEDGRLKTIGWLISEIGPNPVYEMTEQGEPLVVVHPGVGAPLAAGFMEELITVGVRKFIVCGGCGVLEPEIIAGHPVILTSAIRDEGTSYHYLPPGREVSADPQAISALELTFSEHNLPYRLSKSWTTDGIYRETVARRASRLEEGCEVVEMEAAAFFAVAQFRKVKCGQVVYGGDLVHPEGWDARSWNDLKSDRQLLFWLAVEACLRL